MVKRRQRRTLAQELLFFFGMYMVCAVTFQINKQIGLWLIYASLVLIGLRLLSFVLFRVVIPAFEITGEIVQDFTDILRILYHVTLGPVVRLCAPLLEMLLQATISQADKRQRNNQAEEEPHTQHRRSNSERSREAPPGEQTETPEERQRRRQEQRHRMEEEAQKQHPSCFSVLDIPPDADYETARRAYLELSKKYHPDRVQHLGEEFQELAEERFKAIQKAWEEFKRIKTH